MYAIPPLPSEYNQNFAHTLGAFTLEELKKIVKLGESHPKIRGVIGSAEKGAALTDWRNSSIAWIKPTEASHWLFEKMCKIAYDANAVEFGFDLFGMVDHLQYTVYDSRRGKQHYDWHVDRAAKGSMQRKLGLSLLLSEPMEFEGGELWIQGLTREPLPKVRGCVYTFPSTLSHRVTPVTSGVRRSLVGWVSGPRFR